MKLSKQEIKAHEQAEALIESDRPLKDFEKEFILDNWQESANHVNSKAGAFFTPRDLARDFAIEVNGSTCIDLCAGIGSLAYAVEEKFERMVCVEINRDYARIGKRIVPHAEWIVTSVFDPVILDLGMFDCSIGNPPFGSIASNDYVGPYTGKVFEYRVIEVASRISRYGVFIIPQMSAPFQYSGVPSYREIESPKVTKFVKDTGIIMEPNCGINTSVYRDQWRGASPVTEIVCCDFDETRKVD